MTIKLSSFTILEDAIATARNFKDTFPIIDKGLRELEQADLLDRIIGDIRTVIRIEGVHDA